MYCRVKEGEGMYHFKLFFEGYLFYQRSCRVINTTKKS